MDKPICLGLAVLELTKIQMYETYYDFLKPFSGEKILQTQYVDEDGMILSMKTQNIIGDLKNSEDIFDFNNLDKNQEKFSNKNEKVFGKFKIETPQRIWIDDFVCLRSKMYSFKCGDRNKNEMIGVLKLSQSMLNLKVTKNFSDCKE